MLRSDPPSLFFPSFFFFLGFPGSPSVMGRGEADLALAILCPGFSTKPFYPLSQKVDFCTNPPPWHPGGSKSPGLINLLRTFFLFDQIPKSGNGSFLNNFLLLECGFPGSLNSCPPFPFKNCLGGVGRCPQAFLGGLKGFFFFLFGYFLSFIKKKTGPRKKQPCRSAYKKKPCWFPPFLFFFQGFFKGP